MKTKQKKVLSLLLAVAVFFSLVSCFTQTVFAESVSTTVDSSTMHRVICTSTTSPQTTRSFDYIFTIYHVYGTQDVRSVAGTYYYSAEQTLTSPLYPDTFAAQSTQLKLYYTKQMVAAPDMKVVVPADRKSATYKVYLYWSGVILNQKVLLTYSGGGETRQDRTVLYVPCSTSKITGTDFLP